MTTSKTVSSQNDASEYPSKNNAKDEREMDKKWKLEHSSISIDKSNNMYSTI